MGKIIISGDWHIKKGIYTSLAIDFLDYAYLYYKENKINLSIVGPFKEKNKEEYNSLLQEL